MTFEFWLIDPKNNINFLLPVTPGNYKLDYGNDIQTVESLGLGSIHLAGHRRPRSISLSSFFTTQDYPFKNRVTYPVVDCGEYVKLIQKWVDEKAIIRLVITSDAITKINEQFYIESIAYTETAKTNGDIDYTITLREFRPLQTPMPDTKSTTSKTENKPRAQQPKPTQKSRTYTVQSGDYLSKIARQFYGDANQWRKIYEANKVIIGKNPNLIRPGQVCVIP